MELRNLETAPRFDYDEPDLPRPLAETNHFQKLADPSPWPRNATILNNVAAWNDNITLDRLWENCGDIEMDNEGEFYGDMTAQTMIFIPAKKRIGVAYADQGALALEHKRSGWIGRTYSAPWPMTILLMTMLPTMTWSMTMLTDRRQTMANTAPVVVLTAGATCFSAAPWRRERERTDLPSRQTPPHQREPALMLCRGRIPAMCECAKSETPTVRP